MKVSSGRQRSVGFLRYKLEGRMVLWTSTCEGLTKKRGRYRDWRVVVMVEFTFAYVDEYLAERMLLRFAKVDYKKHLLSNTNLHSIPSFVAQRLILYKDGSGKLVLEILGNKDKRDLKKLVILVEVERTGVRGMPGEGQNACCVEKWKVFSSVIKVIELVASVGRAQIKKVAIGQSNAGLVVDLEKTRTELDKATLALRVAGEMENVLKTHVKKLKGIGQLMSEATLNIIKATEVYWQGKRFVLEAILAAEQSAAMHKSGKSSWNKALQWLLAFRAEKAK